MPSRLIIPSTNASVSSRAFSKASACEGPGASASFTRTCSNAATNHASFASCILSSAVNWAAVPGRPTQRDVSASPNHARQSDSSERWELGEQIAGVLVCSDVERERCRETCVRFHHAHARALSLAGDVEGSRRQIRAAGEAWPEIKGDLVEDRELEAMASPIPLRVMPPIPEIADFVARDGDSPADNGVPELPE